MSEEEYYYDEYYQEEEDILGMLSMCIFPVIAQVTAVFLKIYGLSAIVSTIILAVYYKVSIGTGKEHVVKFTFV